MIHYAVFHNFVLIGIVDGSIEIPCHSCNEYENKRSIISNHEVVEGE